MPCTSSPKTSPFAPEMGLAVCSTKAYSAGTTYTPQTKGASGAPLWVTLSTPAIRGEESWTAARPVVCDWAWQSEADAFT